MAQKTTKALLLAAAGLTAGAAGAAAFCSATATSAIVHILL